ncbi:MAG: hypothetical protein A2297_09150 [Elusimicrobia bacterium RIFOXYB2_FULL_48_7]|nr:MAG: hypothetical protein A2297_09150 [Elusimicrobia bacterium RIFOXYB2_FULL_48_7]
MLNTSFVKGLVKISLTVKVLVALLVLCCVSSGVYAGAGSEGGDFLNIGIGARAIAMGGAFTGLSDDISAGYWNPGGLVQLKSTEFLTMYDTLFEGMSHIYLGLGKKLEKGSVIGAQVNYLTSGDIAGVDKNGNALGNFSTNSTAMTVTYSGYMSETVGYGISLKTVTENIAGLNGSGLGADLGLLYKGETMNLGLAVQNLGSGITYDGDTQASPFPVVVRAGLGYYLTRTEVNSFVVSADLSKISSDESLGMGLGMEYKTGVMAFRGGILKSGEAMVPCMGIGIGSGNITFDIGTGQYENLNSTYKISLIGKFGAPDSGNVARPVKSAGTPKVKSFGKAREPQAVDSATQTLEAQYEQAIAVENYEKAKELTKKIAQKQVLDEDMNKAIAAEDYEKAKEIKKKIKDLEN